MSQLFTLSSNLTNIPSNLSNTNASIQSFVNQQNTDFNWLFSSISQSFAAIVGLIGAFLISKIIANQNEYKNKISQLENNLAKASSILILLIRYPNLDSQAEARKLVVSNNSLYYSFKNETEYSRFLKYSVFGIILIYILGVFLPLLYLPTNITGHTQYDFVKLLIIITVSLIMIVFFGYFMYEVGKLKYNTITNKPLISILEKLLSNDAFLLYKDDGKTLNDNNDIKRSALIDEINATLKKWNK